MLSILIRLLRYTRLYSLNGSDTLHTSYTLISSKDLATAIKDELIGESEHTLTFFIHGLVFLIFLSLGGCQSLPDTPHIDDSIELTKVVQQSYHSEQGSDVIPRNSFFEVIKLQSERHEGLSGYYPLIMGSNAFASRSILTDMSSTSIDVQYYIWHNDEAGQLLLKHLWEAAERGVYVRLLLDDFNNNAELDQQLLRFSSHPNIAVRLMNPFSHRRIQALNFITDLRRINHRMHNKSMTFDRSISIVGGRNVGDEYFSNGESSQFADLDVLLIGEVVGDIQSNFEDYWQSDLAYDVETLVEANDISVQDDVSDQSHSQFLTGLDKIDRDTPDSLSNKLLIYTQTLGEELTQEELIEQRLPFRWVNIQFITDEVAKLTNSAPTESHLVHQLRTLLGKPNEKLTIISSYFVPTADGVDTLIELAEQGVEVKILTNSFTATDVTAVHSGYEQWRVPLLTAGIELYELKATAKEEDRENKLWRARSQSSTSLHAKTFAVDSPKVFIGSYNVDPRSANINTEMGVIINDDALAQQLHDAVSDEALLDLAYEVVLTDDNKLQWQTIEEEELVIYDSEPDVDLNDKVWMRLMSWMPIDWLL